MGGPLDRHPCYIGMVSINGTSTCVGTQVRKEDPGNNMRFKYRQDERGGGVAQRRCGGSHGAHGTSRGWLSGAGGGTMCWDLGRVSVCQTWIPKQAMCNNNNTILRTPSSAVRRIRTRDFVPAQANSGCC